MKTPRFLSTKKVKLDLSRYSLPTYVDGKLVQSPPVIVTIEANVQPLTKSTGTQFLPEEAKVKRGIIFWSASEIKQKIEFQVQQQADRLYWEGELYEVVRSIHYNMGILNHWEAVALVVDPE